MTEEQLWGICESVAGSGSYAVQGKSQMQVEVLCNLLADFARQGGDWRKIYEGIYGFWHTRLLVQARRGTAVRMDEAD